MMVPPQTPSPRAQEMGQRLALTVAEFRQKYPDLSEEEVRQALALAHDHSPDEGRRAPRAVAAVVAAIAVAAGLGWFLLGGRGLGPHGSAVPAMVAVGIALVAAVVARRRRE